MTSIKSINIFGITGGIGSSFAKVANEKNVTVNGFYYTDDILANAMRINLPNAAIDKINLSSPLFLDNVNIPNHEGILFVAGKPHFSENIFDFTQDELLEQFNINVYSFVSIIKSIISKPNNRLKKIVFVSSEIPNELKSIYHLTKVIQEKTMELLKEELISRGVGISIIKTGWVDTKMYAAYKSKHNTISKNVKSPSDIAKVCLEEFQNTVTQFKIITV